MTSWNAILLLEFSHTQPDKIHFSKRCYEMEANKCHIKYQVQVSPVEVYLRCPDKSATVW